MRWLTWMATLAFLAISGCGGSGDGGSTSPAPGGSATTPTPRVETKMAPPNVGATTAAPSPGTKTSPPPTRQKEAGEATSSPSPVTDSKSSSPATTEGAKTTPGAPKAATEEAKPTIEPEPAVEQGPPEMPKVNLGQGAYAQSTLLKVGDTVPEIAVTDLGGAATTVALPAADELLVLVFWDSKNTYSKLELRWLQRALAGREGVRVVAIDRGESAETVRDIVDKEKLSFPVLLDADGALFGKFATETVPRTYLIGEGGKILWLEVTFQGRTTITTLEQAIAAAQAE